MKSISNLRFESVKIGLGHMDNDSLHVIHLHCCRGEGATIICKNKTIGIEVVLPCCVGNFDRKTVTMTFILPEIEASAAKVLRVGGASGGRGSRGSRGGRMRSVNFVYDDRLSRSDVKTKLHELALFQYPISISHIFEARNSQFGVRNYA